MRHAWEVMNNELRHLLRPFLDNRIRWLLLLLVFLLLAPIITYTWWNFGERIIGLLFDR